MNTRERIRGNCKVNYILFLTSKKHLVSQLWQVVTLRNTELGDGEEAVVAVRIENK